MGVLKRIFMCMALAALVVPFTGCDTNVAEDNTKPEEKDFLYHAGKVASVISPLTLGARIIIQEVGKDLENNYGSGGATGTSSTAASPSGTTDYIVVTEPVESNTTTTNSGVVIQEEKIISSPGENGETVYYVID